jgi:hypothetical protein
MLMRLEQAAGLQTGFKLIEDAQAITMCLTLYMNEKTQFTGQQEHVKNEDIYREMRQFGYFYLLDYPQVW